MKWAYQNLPKGLLPFTYGSKLDILTVSIAYRRKLLDPINLVFFENKSQIFGYSPFRFDHMAKAVERAFQAIELKQNIMILGDTDVDGIGSVLILYEFLKSQNAHVHYYFPQGEQTFGLEKEQIDLWKTNDIQLLFVLDCGSSSIDTVGYAQKLGIDVIILDHHLVQDPPPAYAFINSQYTQNKYPFPNICSAAMTAKFVWACCFSQTLNYKENRLILDYHINPTETFLSEKEKLNEEEFFKQKDFSQKLSQHYPYVWCVYHLYNGIVQKTQVLSDEQLSIFLDEHFSQQQEVTHKEQHAWISTSAFEQFSSEQQKLYQEWVMPGLKETIDLWWVLSQNGYQDLFSSHTQQEISQERLAFQEEQQLFWEYKKTFIEFSFICHCTLFYEQTMSLYKKGLDLLALACIADLMPLVQENHVFVAVGLSLMGKGQRPNMDYLLTKMQLMETTIEASRLSWTLIPLLNSAGRMGQAHLVADYLTCLDLAESLPLASQLMELNEQRKQLSQGGTELAYQIVSQHYHHQKPAPPADLLKQQGDQGFFYHPDLSCYLVYSKEFAPGLTGLIASHLSKTIGSHVMIVAFKKDASLVGSIRTYQQNVAMDILHSLQEFFLDYGGHHSAAGFSLSPDHFSGLVSSFLRLKKTAHSEHPSEEQLLWVDAHLPEKYVQPQLKEILNYFSPYGFGFSPLLFSMTDVLITGIRFFGKQAIQHVELQLWINHFSWKAIYWKGSSWVETEKVQINGLVDFVGSLQIKEYKSNQQLQFQIEDIHWKGEKQ